MTNVLWALKTELVKQFRDSNGYSFICYKNEIDF